MSKSIAKFIIGSVVTSMAIIPMPASALNNNYSPALTDSQIQYYLNNPKDATGSAGQARYGTTDDVGNSMDSPSIIQMTGQSYKYAAVYHTGVCVATCSTTPVIRFKMNLAVSNDIINWHFVRQLGDNWGMPRIVQVSGSNWIMLAHEKYQAAGSGSGAPVSADFELYYDTTALLAGTIASNWSQPIYNGGPNHINGTPSIYDAHLAMHSGYYDADGQYGFHYNVSPSTSPTDLNAVTTVTKMFNPLGGTTGFPSVATAYNNLLISLGATDAVGQRDTLLTTTNRYNLQEIHFGTPGGDWQNWRVWLYKFTETTAYPTGAGTVTPLSPLTPSGSTAFGNPSIAVVDRPSGGGKALVVSYYLFGQGAAPGEAGSLIYYFNI